VLLLGFDSGCTVFRRAQLEQVAGASTARQVVRVVRTDGSRVMVFGAAIRGDSLVGRQLNYDGEPIAMARGDIRSVAIARVDMLRTSIGVAMVAASVVATWVLLVSLIGWTEG